MGIKFISTKEFKTLSFREGKIKILKEQILKDIKKAGDLIENFLLDIEEKQELEFLIEKDKELINILDEIIKK